MMKRTLLLALSLLLLVGAVSCGKGARDLPLFDRVLSADKALEAAKKNGTVVFEDSHCTAGQKTWDEFYRTASRGEAASVLCACYYTLDKDRMDEALYEAEKDDYPMLFFYRLEFDGKEYTLTTRQSTEKKAEETVSFPYLVHYSGDMPEGALSSRYDFYVLVEDDSVTWEEIQQGMYSSHFDAGIPHRMVYQNYMD